MSNMTFPIEKLQGLQTPFYYYDTKLLDETLSTIKQELMPTLP